MPYYRQSISFGPPLTRMVKNLILVMSAVFVVTYIIGSLPSEVTRTYLYVYPRLLFGVSVDGVFHHLFVWQPFTYLFIHGGFLHIIFNVFALWMFGSELESMWGGKRFLFYFFLTGVGAAICNLLLNLAFSSDITVPTIGCSGAVYGLLLAYGLLFPDRLILLSFLIPIKAKWFVVIMGVMEFVGSYSDAGSGISHVAHLGGMLFGFLYLRGRGLPINLQGRYQDWRRARLRRKFEVYMRRHEGKDDPGRWIN